jgi:hypothetical protein
VGAVGATLKGFALELADPDVADDVIFDSSDDSRSAAPVAAAPMLVYIAKLPLHSAHSAAYNFSAFR